MIGGVPTEVDAFGRKIEAPVAAPAPDLSTMEGLQKAAAMGQIPVPGKQAPIAVNAPILEEPVPPPPSEQPAIAMPAELDMSAGQQGGGTLPVNGQRELDMGNFNQQPAMMPAAMQSSTTTTPGYKVPAKLQKEQAKIDEERARVAEEATQIGIAKAVETEAMKLEQAKITESSNQQAQDLAERQNAQLGTMREDLAAKNKAADAAPVDPGRFFAQKGTLAQIGAAFAVAMGAYSSAFTGQKNYALDIVNDAIDKDIMAQKETKAGLSDAVNRQRAAIEDARQIYGDERLALESMRIQKLTAVANNWEARVAKLGSQEARVKGMEQVAALRQEVNDRLIKFDEAAREKVQTSASVTMAPSMPKSMMSKEQFDQAKDLRHEYENNEQVKQGRDELQNAAKVGELVKSAKAGNAEAGQALTSLWARYVNGPGVLTQTDFDRAKLSGDIFNSAAAKMSKGLFGEMTDKEVEAASRAGGMFRVSGQRRIAQVADRYLRLSARTGTSADLVVASPEERNIALEKDKPTAGSAALALGLKREGSNPVAIAKK
jgi:hypothetical protein